LKNRKDFNQAILRPAVDEDGVVITQPVLKPGIPDNAYVSWAKNASTYRGYDFTKHYGQGFDAITSAVQQTIEIMITESVVEVSTISGYCHSGFKYFAAYLAIYARALGRELALSDISLELIENTIQYLKINHPNSATAKGYYTHIKSILVKMQAMGWLERFDFPKNPFPNSNRDTKGQKAFSKAERKRVAKALRDDVNNIIAKKEPLTGYELTIFLLAIALRSGMNTTPLLEMTIDSLQAHPLKENRRLLVLYKRRGNATPIQSLRHSKKVENAQTVLADVAVMAQHIIDMNQSIRAEGETDLVFSYRSQGGSNANEITNIASTRLTTNIKKWVQEKGLKNDNDDPLQVNISRFRKTFENRIWELSGGDPFVTASLANHSVKVSDTHYLEAPKEAEKNFNYMGKVRTKELINVEVIENNTPVSKCSDIPFRTDNNGNKIYCTDFLSCVRCRNMVVTKEDLYRLFSFYWLIVYEREQIGAKRWSKYFAHIIRIIDRDIAPQFDADYVAKMKAEAQTNPHPAWKHRHQLEEVA
jgi:integrase